MIYRTIVFDVSLIKNKIMDAIIYFYSVKHRVIIANALCVFQLYSTIVISLIDNHEPIL